MDKRAHQIEPRRDMGAVMQTPKSRMQWRASLAPVMRMTGRAQFGSDGVTIPQSLALTDSERSTCERARDDLRQATAPAPASSHRDAIGILVAAYPIGSASPEGRITGYAIACEEFPVWAVNETVRAVMQGRVGDPAFAPAPGVIAQYARALVAELRADLYRVEALLSARVIETDKPARVLPKAVASLLGRLGADASEPHPGE